MLQKDFPRPDAQYGFRKRDRSAILNPTAGSLEFKVAALEGEADFCNNIGATSGHPPLGLLKQTFQLRFAKSPKAFGVEDAQTRLC